jgi:hypothetical protein
MAKEKPSPTITLVFLHICEDGSFRYVHIGEDDNDGCSLEDSPQYLKEREKNYSHKKPSRAMASAQPGTVITVECDPEKELGQSIYPSTAVLVEQWKHQDDVVKWRSIHRARQGEIESGQAAARANRRDLPAEHLAPFRDASHLEQTSEVASTCLGHRRDHSLALEVGPSTLKDSDLLQEATNRLKTHSHNEIRRLSCRVDGDTVIVEGVVSSFYYKSLAQQAVMGINGNTVVNQTKVRD